MEKDVLEIVRNSPKVVGTKQVLAGIIEDTLRCVVVSSDCDKFIADKITGTAKSRSVRIFRTPSKKDLGRACGIDVACAAVGILKES